MLLEKFKFRSKTKIYELTIKSQSEGSKTSGKDYYLTCFNKISAKSKKVYLNASIFEEITNATKSEKIEIAEKYLKERTRVPVPRWSN